MVEASDRKKTAIVLNLGVKVCEDVELQEGVYYVKVEFKQPKQDLWTEVGNSPTIGPSKEMSWNYGFEHYYSFHIEQLMKLSLYNFMNENASIVGQSIAELKDLVRSSRTEVPFKDTNERLLGIFVVDYEEIKEDTKKIIFQLSGEYLADMDFFDKSDPYYIIYKDDNDHWRQVFKSEVIDNNLNPNWETVMLSYSEFCYSNPENLIKIECWDYDTSTKSDFIGRCIFKAKDLVAGNHFQLRNHNEKNAPTGKIRVKVAQVFEDSSFLELLRNGMSLNTTIAIDFTASNGLPTINNSLHYFDENKESEYAQVIRALGEVLGKYDSDKKVPIFGFGGSPWGSGRVKHDFTLTGDEEHPWVSDFDEAVQLYRSALKDIELRGPTNFASVIKRQVKMIEEAKGETYFILVIITDGEIDDYDETVVAIVEASVKPLSIIIIGVGYESFAKMINLDGDQKKLSTGTGRKAVRDIVQFVRFRSFKKDLHAFIEEALKEIPFQMIKYKNLNR